MQLLWKGKIDVRTLNHLTHFHNSQKVSWWLIWYLFRKGCHFFYCQQALEHAMNSFAIFELFSIWWTTQTFLHYQWFSKVLCDLQNKYLKGLVIKHHLIFHKDFTIMMHQSQYFLYKQHKSVFNIWCNKHHEISFFTMYQVFKQCGSYHLQSSTLCKCTKIYSLIHTYVQ